MTRRLASADAFVLAKDVPTAPPRRPVLDDVVDRPRRQQRPSLALMPTLRALLAPRPILAALGGLVLARRIAARRLRRVTRRTPDPPLELRNPLILRSDALLQALNLLVHPQQHRDDRFAALVINRFGLRAVHTRKIPCKSRKPCPTTDELNAYRTRCILQGKRDAIADRSPRKHPVSAGFCRTFGTTVVPSGHGEAARQHADLCAQRLRELRDRAYRRVDDATLDLADVRLLHPGGLRQLLPR